MELVFNIKEVLRYMGVRGAAEAPPALVQAAEAAAARVRALAAPGYHYRAFALERAADGIRLAGTAFVLTGAQIQKHLSGCETAVLLYATLGFAVDREILRLQGTALSQALALDAAACEGLEGLCGAVCARIQAEFPAFSQRPRFSPGYADLPLAASRGILALLDAGRRSGVTLNAGNMMNPTKTVTAIVGLTPKEN
ncbi:MAG: methionine synthase [Clostridiales bacterium]|jgi:5-methyltetrahydrofolate--homocysteine methyltransferase|nr:methionine synthase [Clostridiales bacterium]